MGSVTVTQPGQASRAERRPARTATRALILGYHGLSRAGAMAAPGHEAFYTLDADAFRKQMQCITAELVRCCLLEELADGGDRQPIVITFDDGSESDFTIALPILQRLGLAGTFFVCVEYIGKPGYMDWGQIEGLLQAGMSVQSHGLLHHDLTALSADDVADELWASRRCLERNLGTKVRYIAIPGGFANEQVYEAAFRAGYEGICNSAPGLSGPGPIWNRVIVQKAMSEQQFVRLVRRDRRQMLSLAVLNRAIGSFKRLVGVERYESMKARLWH